MSVVETIVEMFAKGGSSVYFGEAVTQEQHALQAAHFAEQAGADSPLIVAALLHDIGHLLHQLPEDFTERGIDDRHEDGGAHWLARHFGPAIVDPVRLHVDAKRYLCAVEPGYLAKLSPTSQQSLRNQGGPMSPEEVTAFEAEPRFRDAVSLRRWDDNAKIVDLPTPPIDHFRKHLAAALNPLAG